MDIKALIISDEPETARIWGLALNQIGIEFSLTNVNGDISALIAEQPHDIIILEDFNQQMEEIPVCQQLRTESVSPILFLTTKMDENFLMEAYRAGADEVIPFPITPRLFQAKVTAWLRRIASVPLAALDELKVGKFTFYPNSRLLSANGNGKVRLTVLESRLLYVLMNHPKRLFEPDHLIVQIWGSCGGGDRSMLKSLVYRLRRKIEPQPNEPVYLLSEGNQGYKFQA